MGMRRADYVILGIQLDVDDIIYEDYEAEIELKDGRRFDMIYDGVCEEFCFAGRILTSTDEYEGFEVMDILSEAHNRIQDDFAALSEEFGPHVRQSIFVVTVWR